VKEVYPDIEFDLYTCPICKGKYEHFRDVMNCYKKCQQEPAFADWEGNNIND